jgi:hypothetical protein
MSAQNAETASSTANNIFSRLGNMATPLAQAVSAISSSSTGQKIAKKIAASPAATKIANALSKFGSKSKLATMQHLVDAMIAYTMGVVSGLQVWCHGFFWQDV